VLGQVEHGKAKYIPFFTRLPSVVKGPLVILRVWDDGDGGEGLNRRLTIFRYFFNFRLDKNIDCVLQIRGQCNTTRYTQAIKQQIQVNVKDKNDLNGDRDVLS
jgi:hypothetical protein